MNDSTRFKMIREKIGLSQAKFAEILECSQSKIKNIELGNQKIPVELAQKISKKYNIDFKWLMTGEGEAEQVKKMFPEERLQEIYAVRKATADKLGMSPDEADKLMVFLTKEDNKELLMTFITAIMEDNKETLAEVIGMIKMLMIKNKTK